MGNCQPSFWQNRRRRRAAARRQWHAALLLAHPVLGSHLRPCNVKIDHALTFGMSKKIFFLKFYKDRVSLCNIIRHCFPPPVVIDKIECSVHLYSSPWIILLEIISNDFFLFAPKCSMHICNISKTHYCLIFGQDCS